MTVLRLLTKHGYLLGSHAQTIDQSSNAYKKAIQSLYKMQSSLDLHTMRTSVSGRIALRMIVQGSILPFHMIYLVKRWFSDLSFASKSPLYSHVGYASGL